MTSEQRKELEDLQAQERDRWGEQDPGYLALTAVLSAPTRTCGTCRHGVSNGGGLDCLNENALGYWMGYYIDPDDGCIQGWEAREP